MVTGKDTKWKEEGKHVNTKTTADLMARGVEASLQELTYTIKPIQ